MTTANSPPSAPAIGRISFIGRKARTVRQSAPEGRPSRVEHPSPDQESFQIAAPRLKPLHELRLAG
jgi:hypothetical protein